MTLMTVCPSCGPVAAHGRRRYCDECLRNGKAKARRLMLRQAGAAARRERRWKRQLATARPIAELWLKSCDRAAAYRMAAAKAVTRRALETQIAAVAREAGIIA